MLIPPALLLCVHITGFSPMFSAGLLACWSTFPSCLQSTDRVTGHLFFHVLDYRLTGRMCFHLITLSDCQLRGLFGFHVFRLPALRLVTMNEWAISRHSKSVCECREEIDDIPVAPLWEGPTLLPPRCRRERRIRRLLPSIVGMLSIPSYGKGNRL